MNNGFFKIYRELWDKPIWKQSTPIQKTVLLTLLSRSTSLPPNGNGRGKSSACSQDRLLPAYSILPNVVAKVSTQVMLGEL
jgi:hypothetical protein